MCFVSGKVVVRFGMDVTVYPGEGLEDGMERNAFCQSNRQAWGTEMGRDMCVFQEELVRKGDIVLGMFKW